MVKTYIVVTYSVLHCQCLIFLWHQTMSYQLLKWIWQKKKSIYLCYLHRTSACSKVALEKLQTSLLSLVWHSFHQPVVSKHLDSSRTGYMTTAHMVSTLFLYIYKPVLPWFNRCSPGMLLRSFSLAASLVCIFSSSVRPGRGGASWPSGQKLFRKCSK